MSERQSEDMTPEDLNRRHLAHESGVLCRRCDSQMLPGLYSGRYCPNCGYRIPAVADRDDFVDAHLNPSSPPRKPDVEREEP